MSSESLAQSSPLEDRLIALIKLKGPISIADYMSDALCHPHDGYYNSQLAIGADGDFTTAPEISQVFGELVGAWVVETWRALGSPSAFNLIELGPGRGVLMADILRVAQLRAGFTKAATLWLVETSGLLRHEQQKRLRSTKIDPMWADEFADIAPAPSIIVANEFFDCLPIRQFERTALGWRERLVGVAAEGNRLEFVLDETPPRPSVPLPSLEESKVGDIFEISEAVEGFTADLCKFLVEFGGRALIIDYGHLSHGVGETLQSVRNHAYWPPLSTPGLADITAHVNFESLSRSAIEAGAAVYGPTSQGLFLERLGLSARVNALCASKSAEQTQEIQSGAHRIAAPDQMGEIFKASLHLGAVPAAAARFRFMSTPPRLRSSLLDDESLNQGFFSRDGGISTGDFASLNVGPGSQDAPEKIAENRRRCAEALGVEPDHLLSLYQIHSSTVVEVDGPWVGAPPQADAMVTKKPGLALGILTADCMPFLLADIEVGVIGAAHAGWRGALAGVLENTVAAMTEIGAKAERIRAGLGPCLRQPNFEVGLDLVDAFSSKFPDSQRYFSPGATPEKRQFDLASFGFERLRSAGVSQIDDVSLCTLEAEDRYFSYRASRRAEQIDYGRNLSAIVLK